MPCYFLNVVFGIFSKHAPFQLQITNLGLKTEAIFKGKFTLDYPFAQEYFAIAVSLRSQANPSA